MDNIVKYKFVCSKCPLDRKGYQCVEFCEPPDFGSYFSNWMLSAPAADQFPKTDHGSGPQGNRSRDLPTTDAVQHCYLSDCH